MKSAKQRLIDAGYTVYKSSTEAPHSLRRFVTRDGRDNPWLVNNHEEMEKLADLLCPLDKHDAATCRKNEGI